MEKTTAWVIVTDGNYLKILVDAHDGTGLKHLRTDDFAQTSELTYKLITSKRGVQDEDDIHYFTRLLGEFLAAKAAEGLYDSLVLVCPRQTGSEIRQLLPSQVAGRVQAVIDADHLHTPLDELEVKLLASLRA